MPTTPASYSFRLDAYAFAADATGCFMNGVKNEPGAVQRLDFSTGKLCRVPAPAGITLMPPFGILRPGVLLAARVTDERAALVALDGATGEELVRFPDCDTSKGRVDALAASADGTVVGVLMGRDEPRDAWLELFDAQSGKRLDRIADARAFAFVGDDVVWFGWGVLCRRPIRGKKVTRFETDSSNFNERELGAMREQGGKVLSCAPRSSSGVFDPTTGRELLNVHFGLGWAGDDAVVAAGKDGALELVNLSGKVVRRFFRPRKNHPDHCFGNGDWVGLKAGAFLEIYRVTEGTPQRAAAPARKQPAARAPVKSVVPAKAALAAAETYFKHPTDEALSVWADLLTEHGDPRGEFINLSLRPDRTDEQEQALWKLIKKQGGKLVGPAREYVREWNFGPKGLVSHVTCEAPRFVEGFEEIARLNPELGVSLTSLRKQTAPTVAALARLPLERLDFLSLESNALSDKSMKVLAPALAKVRRLSLAYNDFGPDGLLALLSRARRFEYLCVDARHLDTLLARPLAAGKLNLKGARREDLARARKKWGKAIVEGHAYDAASLAELE